LSGDADYAINVDNRDSTVGMRLIVRVWVDGGRVDTIEEIINPGQVLGISTVFTVPPDSKYKIRFKVRDLLSNQLKVTGKFKNQNDCISPDPDQETTTTLPALGSTTTTTQPVDEGDEFDEEDEFDDDEDEFFELTDNSFIVWDDFDEDIFFTDGNYRIRYRFTKNAIQLAATGIDLDYIVTSGIIFLASGIVLLTSSRKKKLMQSEISLEDIYKSAFKLKTKLEKSLKQKVEINIDINKFAPYAKSFPAYQEEIEALNNELNYTLVAVDNIKTICQDDGQDVTQEILEERLSLITKNFEIVYTGSDLVVEAKTIKTEVPKQETKKIKRKFFERKQLRRPALGLAVASIFVGMGFGIYATQQMYLSDIQQDNAQEYLEKIYLGEDIDALEQPENILNPLNIFQSDIPVFDMLQDFTVIDQVQRIEEYKPSVFGLLEIPEINVNQYVVSGTDDLSLQFGPGYYLGTNLPGSGGNVGIAGHRTTYGAPFSQLDLVEIGDEILLTVGSNKYHYKVDEVEIVDAVSGSYVLYNRGDDRITLTTCHPKYSARQRLVVSGILHRIESGN
tara:strand:- start:1674 stop:3362 length:1689 start_codon:yes stop_codon:yes gene_type:complete